MYVQGLKQSQYISGVATDIIFEPLTVSCSLVPRCPHLFNTLVCIENTGESGKEAKNLTHLTPY